MEADWEVEIGKEAPVIDACWNGRLDLRTAPHLAAQLPESRQLPAVADALAQLNSSGSPVWTSKCDVWIPARFDPDELDAQAEEAVSALACYIDLLPASDAASLSPEAAITACQAWCARLRNVTLRCCRADLIIRLAYLVPDRQDFGITAYLTACGSTPGAARAALASALEMLTDAVCAFEHPENAPPKLQ